MRSPERLAAHIRGYTCGVGNPYRENARPSRERAPVKRRSESAWGEVILFLVQLVIAALGGGHG